MKKVIYLFAATLAFSIQGATIAAELTENIDNGDLNKLQRELCNNYGVTQILTTNELDEILYVETTSGTISYGGGDDDGSSFTVISNPPPLSISAQDSINILCS
ncbi:MAG: hypothetical protein QNJ34_23965 [Xenococcaceae cyanobacterium MO_188.B29]|nr:hypothetical protein [Xenococcaceae cyanobacterium MO_188.B29]